MDGFEWNKVLMGLILALLIGKVSGKVAELLVHPDLSAPNVYSHGDADQGTKGGAAPAAEDVLEPIEPLLASANVQEGEKIAKKCLQCHVLEKGGANKQGPHLWDVVNRPIAHDTTFTYSDGAMAIGKEGKKWDYANLNAFLHKPRNFIKGTKMSFVGVSKTQERADLIAYLRTLSDSPAPLPPAGAAAPVATPAAEPKAGSGAAPAGPATPAPAPAPAAQPPKAA
ncbi:MAG: cytochrome c family protein [Proteobacteria bacterium]|nr:cytochrome c family protein [Pseudomonadota bacterium]